MASVAASTPSRTGRSKKAVVAAALGVALLAGGGGTFANWYENTAIAGGSVTAGHLNLTVDTANQVWKDQTGATIDPGTFKMVPGDTVTYTVTATPDMVGTNLKANLAVQTAAITGTLAPYVSVTTAISDAGTPIANPLTPATGNKPLSVTVTISMPFTTADGNGIDAENGTLDLTSVKLGLTQVP